MLLAELCQKNQLIHQPVQPKPTQPNLCEPNLCEFITETSRVEWDK